MIRSLRSRESSYFFCKVVTEEMRMVVFCVIPDTTWLVVCVYDIDMYILSPSHFNR